MLRDWIKNVKNNIFYAIIFVFAFVLIPNNTFAATLNIFPSKINTSTGQIFSVKVNVDTENKAINNAESVINYPTDLLEVVSVSKSPSIFSIWITEPSYSSGQIKFNGGIASPGFTGPSGTIATIVFKAKKQGNASLIFSDSAVRQNDGLGTDILSSKNGGTIVIASAAPVKEPELKPATVFPVTSKENKTLSKPVIVSTTHPDSEAWYSSRTASFKWEIPKTATSIQTLYSRNIDSTPSVTYDSSVTEKTLTDLGEKTFYFHLRYLDGGVWSPSAHYKFQIDTVSPEEFEPGVKSSEFGNSIVLNAADETSGIDYYLVKIDDEEEIKIKASEIENNEYVLPMIAKGKHDLAVVAFDKAGNKRESRVTFTSIFEITPPVIELGDKEIRLGDELTVFGKSDYPLEQAKVVFEQNGKEIQSYKIDIDKDGVFILKVDDLPYIGDFNVYAKNIVKGAESDISQIHNLKVIDRSIVNFSSNVYVIALIFILALSVLLFAILGWVKYFQLKKEYY
jgi:hypothetical protein